MIRILITLLLLIFIQNIYCQSSKKESLSIVFLNADSFFDTLDDPGETDDIYTPEGALRWDADKYNKKADEIATIITEINEDETPDIIIFSGLEKEDIAKDILSSRRLRRNNYTIAGGAFYPGSGIAIALKDGAAELLEKRVVISDVNPALAEMSIILYCKLRLSDGAIYHLFINEWPSRSISGMAGETLRMVAAATLRKEIDLILNFERDAKIIVMGSFNDEPTNLSIMNILNASAKRKNFSDRDLYNLYFDMHNNNNIGTIQVNGIWQMYDFIIVSPSLLKEGDHFSTGFDDGRIADPSPSFGPTYRGTDYLGGSGAHLPVIIKLSRIARE